MLAHVVQSVLRTLGLIMPVGSCLLLQRAITNVRLAATPVCGVPTWQMAGGPPDTELDIFRDSFAFSGTLVSQNAEIRRKIPSSADSAFQTAFRWMAKSANTTIYCMLPKIGMISFSMQGRPRQSRGSANHALKQHFT